MTTLTIKNAAGEVIGTPAVSAKTQALWDDRTAPLASFRGCDGLQEWIDHQCGVIQRPGNYPDEAPLAGTQEELLSMVVTVIDERLY